MAAPQARQRLADRASTIWKGGGKSYSDSVDLALAEQNPSGNPTLGEKLLYALLNVDQEIVTARRKSPRAKADRGDIPNNNTPSNSPPGIPAPDGGETHQ